MDQIKTKTTIQNLWDTVKVILRGKFIAIKLISGNKEILNKLNYRKKNKQNTKLVVGKEL